MKKMIKFPKIGQFNEIIQQVQRQATFVGLDENGDAIYDGLRPKPVITVKGTIKLHGTNAGVIYNAVDGIWYQSRENIITPLSGVLYEIEFEDGTKSIYNSDHKFGDILISSLKEGDVITL